MSTARVSQSAAEILQELNPAQREAVETLTGPLLIVAGPGSGKTRVIAHRIAYLVKVCGISPRRILAVTFTNKAAREMGERLLHLLGNSAAELTLGTFHAVCARILRREGKEIGLDPRFIIYDEEDQLEAVKLSMQEANVDARRFPPRVFQSAISAAKSQLLSPEGYAAHHSHYFGEMVRRVYQSYQQLLERNKAVDFDDLIMRTFYLFQNCPRVLAKYQQRYLHVLIDEFQDTNIAQYALAKQLAGKYRNICVVGDPDQSIYGWRFADLRNILNFEKDYPDARVVLLEQNYRSTKAILEAAQKVISVNQQRKEKKLWTENQAGAPVTLVETSDEREEAQFVVSEVERLVSQREASLRDCAVMYRTNAQSRALEEFFLRYGVPYKLVGGVRFYQRREVKDLLAYLRLIHNPDDDLSLTRIINIPPRGIGQRTLEGLSRWAESLGVSLYRALQSLAAHPSGESSPFSSRPARALREFLSLLEECLARRGELRARELLDLVLERSGYRDYLLREADGEERWENVLELRAVAEEYQRFPPAESLASFLEKVTLISDVDSLDETTESVTLITLHQAKGLEFPVVFIVGMEEGVLPHFKSFEQPEQMEEERRLCYVGMTRAKKRLYLVRACHRGFLGGNPSLPSRFLQDIPPHLLLRRQGIESGALVSAGQLAPAPSPPSFRSGDHVRHARFGEGVVLSCSSTRDDQELVVDFGGRLGTKRLLLSLAPLERVA